MEKRAKFRSVFAGVMFALLFVLLLARVYWVQAVEAPVLVEKAKKMWEKSRVLEPQRGVIYDRNMEVLAQDAPAYTVAVNPLLIHEGQAADRVINALAPLLGMDNSAGREKLRSIVTYRNEQGEFAVHREIHSEGWKIDMDVADEIRKVVEERQLPGVYLLEDPKRYYPAGDLASHTLGYQDKQGKAVMGLEAFYNDLLSGTPGMVRYESDMFGYETPNAQIQYEPPVNGQSLRLTLDENIQLYMEQALEKAYYRYQPKSIAAIAVDPMTMEVLGLANMPDFDPNEYWNFGDYGDFFNHVVGSIYEPGSTFKIVTLAAAVEEGLFHPEEKYMSGKIEVAGEWIHDHNYGAGWGEITYLEGLKRSSNVAFVKLGYESLGEERLRRYIQDFGFGTLTGIDLPGEIPGIVDFRRPIEVATATFGQGIAVTAIQQIAAVSAIANGGELMKPYIVKEILDPESGEPVETRSPQVIRRVISEQTARKVGQYLESVISDQEIGTGRRAFLKDYPLAGKTGTAQKVVGGQGYAEDKWVVSFIGYGPVDHPKIALAVIIDEPDMEGDYRNGGKIVSSVFKEIMSKSLRYMGVATADRETEVFGGNEVEIPDVTGMSLAAAENGLAMRGLEYEALGEGGSVLRQYPAGGTRSVTGSKVYLLTESPEQAEIPNFSGKSLRDAMQVCALLEIQCSAEGRGFVRDQSHENKEDRRAVKLFLQPPDSGEENPQESKDPEISNDTDDTAPAEENPQRETLQPGNPPAGT